MIEFIIPGEPVPSRRRVTVAGGHVRSYQTRPSAAGMKSVREFAWAAMDGKPPIEGPVSVAILAFRAKGRPASKIGRERAERREIRPTTRPDLDNYAKLIMDGLTGVCFVDDAQVVTLALAKYFSERPRLEVTVRPWKVKVC